MFSEDESEVVLLDYQLSAILHPAKDLWYFLSLATGEYKNFLFLLKMMIIDVDYNLLDQGFRKSAPLREPIVVREICSSGLRNTIKLIFLCFADHLNF